MGVFFLIFVKLIFAIKQTLVYKKETVSSLIAIKSLRIVNLYCIFLSFPPLYNLPIAQGEKKRKKKNEFRGTNFRDGPTLTSFAELIFAIDQFLTSFAELNFAI